MATQATELLDAPGPMAPVPFRVTRRKRELADTWTLELEPVAGERLRIEPGQFTMLYAFGIGEVPISVSGDIRGPADPHRALGRRRLAGDLRVAARRRARRARPVRQLVAGRGRGRQRRRGGRGRRRARAASPGRLRAPPPPRRVRRGGAPLRQPDARRPALRQGAPAPARAVRPPGRRHRRRRGRELARQGRRGAEADRRRAVRSRLRRGARLRAGDHDALHGPCPARARASRPSGSTSRWSGTCAAGSATAATASSARR